MAVEELKIPKPSSNELEWSHWLARKVRGRAEAVVLANKRVDVLTSKLAWEVEWADKWSQAAGQALYYASVSGREPGVFLLMKSTDDVDSALCCAVSCAKGGIKYHPVRCWEAKVADILPTLANRGMPSITCGPATEDQFRAMLLGH